MNDKLEPVNCGCGGKGDIHFIGNTYIGEYHEFIGKYFICCEECGIKTSIYNSKKEAIKMWNKAMSERTAKVKLQDICWEDTRRYKEGMCVSCGRSVYDHVKYCDECGCRLEWDE